MQASVSRPALEIRIPRENRNRYAYAATVLFQACLEVEVRVCESDLQEIRILDGGRVALRLPIVYGEPGRAEASVPVVAWWRPSRQLRQEGLPERLPLLFPARLPGAEDDGEAGLEAVAEGSWCRFDLFGAAFFLASGRWEVDIARRDPLGRIAGAGSFLEEHGLLGMPVVNYYAILLGCLLRARGVALDQPRRRYRRVVSCDVDRPRDESFYSVYGLARRLARNLLRQRSLASAAETMRRYVGIRRRGWAEDPNNCFSWMAGVNEQAGNRVTFYMLAGGTHRLDGSYSLQDDEIRALGRHLLQRGHRLGLHGSFDSHFKPELFRQELRSLLHWLERIGGAESPLANRQHYLRWNEMKSPNLLHSAGVASDSTLGFFDRAGFRRGLCTPFPLYDLAADRATTVMEQPLVVMEACLLGSSADRIARPDAALDRFARLAAHCRAVRGEFVLLWHNSFFESPGHRQLYQQVIQL